MSEPRRIPMLNGFRISDLVEPAREHRVSIRCEAIEHFACSGRRQERTGGPKLECECSCHEDEATITVYAERDKRTKGYRLIRKEES